MPWGGTIDCHSIEGKGTTFVVHLPVQAIRSQHQFDHQQAAADEEEDVQLQPLYDMDPLYMSVRRFAAIFQDELDKFAEYNGSRI